MPEHASRQEQERLQQGEHGPDRNSHEAKRQRQDPCKGEQHEREERHRPGEHEEDAPRDKEDEGVQASLLWMGASTSDVRNPFPGFTKGARGLLIPGPCLLR